jgi:hypothetical protein
MLEGDLNPASFGSLVPDSESRSGSGKAEKMEKYHLVLTSIVKAGSPHIVFARPIQLLRKVERTNLVWRFTGSQTWKERVSEGVL